MTALRGPLVATSVVGAVAVVVGGVAAGVSGALGALLGAVVVVLFFGSGQYIVGRVLRTNPLLGMNVALLTYIVQIGVLFLILLLFRDTTWFDGRVFGLVVVGCAMVWLLASVRTFLRRDIPYVVPGSGPEGDASTGRPAPPTAGPGGTS